MSEPGTIEEIFLESYDEHSDAIFRYCYFQTSNRDVALDLSQDTFTKTWQYLQKGADIDNIRAFLYRVAKNLIIDYRRKKKSHSLDQITEKGIDFAGKDEQEEIIEAFDVEFVISKLALLEETDREILTMRYVDEMSIKEIGEIQKITTNNVSVRIHRAVEKLKNILEKYEF